MRTQCHFQTKDHGHPYIFLHYPVVWKDAGMWLCIFTFTSISSLLCLHTFWYTMPTNFYISNAFIFLMVVLVGLNSLETSRNCSGGLLHKIGYAIYLLLKEGGGLKYTLFSFKILILTLSSFCNWSFIFSSSAAFLSKVSLIPLSSRASASTLLHLVFHS